MRTSFSADTLFFLIIDQCVSFLFRLRNLSLDAYDVFYGHFDRLQSPIVILKLGNRNRRYDVTAIATECHRITC